MLYTMCMQLFNISVCVSCASRVLWALARAL